MNVFFVLEQKIERARQRIVQLHYEANTGHLGGSLSCLDAMIVLHSEFMRDEDVFILSKGHSASALYITLWSIGKISEASLKTYYQDATALGGHPSASRELGIPFSTGSLGHGLSLSTGMALSRKIQSREGIIFCLCSDGETQEGAFWEALIFSVHHKLNNLVLLIDVNGWQGFGATQDVAGQAIEALDQRIRGFGLETIRCDGHNSNELYGCFSRLRERSALSKFPQVVLLKTRKGNAVKRLEDTLESHYYSPIDDDLIVRSVSE